jgi:hypothetical protein
MPEKPKRLDVPTVVTTRQVDERVCDPPADAIPADTQIHTRWVRNDPQRISEMKRRAGYEAANTSDVNSNHGGYVDRDGNIVKGDLILMKSGRDIAEQTELQRRTHIADMDRQLNRSDIANGLEDRPSHNIRRPGRPRNKSKSVNIPIDLKS